jgi:hypothetical protein
MLESEESSFIEALTSGSIESGDIARILDMFVDFSGIPVAYVETAKSALFISKAPDNFSEDLRLYPLEEIFRLYIHFPVMHSGTLIGSIILNVPQGTFFSYDKILPHLANAIKICELTGDEDTLPIQNDESFIDIMLSGHTGKEDLVMCRNWLKHKRIDPDGEFCAAAVYVYDKDAHAADRSSDERETEISILYERFHGIAKCFPVQFISCIWGGFIVFGFFVIEHSMIKAIANNFEEIALHRRMKNSSRLNLAIGIGDTLRGYENFATSWNQAVNAIKNSILNCDDRIICIWSNIGIDRNIADMASKPDYLCRCTEILEPLLAYDRSHRGILFPTLVSFIVNEWNITASAKGMFLHYNSIKYRYNNIAAIMKIDLDSPRNRFNLTLAVKTYLYSLPIDDFIATISHINKHVDPFITKDKL